MSRVANTAYPKAVKELKEAGILPEGCELRQIKYLNNRIEQDHRFIKRLTKPGMGFFSLETAWRTLQGYEAMNDQERASENRGRYYLSRWWIIRPSLLTT